MDIEGGSGGDGGFGFLLWVGLGVSGWRGGEDAVPEEGTEPGFEMGELGGGEGGEGDGEG